MECNHNHGSTTCKDCNTAIVCKVCSNNHLRGCAGRARKVNQAHRIAEYVYNNLNPADDAISTLERYYRNIERSS